MGQERHGNVVNAELQVYFIPHGETAWSLSGQHTGITEVPLTANGEAMARELASALHDITFSLVWCSPRLRARQTCHLAGLGVQAQIEPDLGEWEYGDYEGQRSAEIRELQPVWDIWTDGCPGGETPANVGARADRLIARLRDLAGTVALVSHGQFGRVLAARWVDLQVAEGQHLAIDPASISILGFDAGHPQRRVISLWNAPA
jgi:broad specificity phosphatase PhoE